VKAKGAAKAVEWLTKAGRLPEGKRAAKDRKGGWKLARIPRKRD
jgi:hypothetical protein